MTFATAIVLPLCVEACANAAYAEPLSALPAMLGKASERLLRR